MEQGADRDHRRPGHPQHEPARRDPVHQRAAQEARPAGSRRLLLHQARQRPDGQDARRPEEDHLPLRDEGRHLDRRRGHGDAGGEGSDARPGAGREVLEIEKQRSAGVITQGERHNKIIDIWHRVTEKVSEEMFREMKKVEKRARRVQPDQHDGRLRRARLARAGAAAGRHARSDVEALGRGHRDADHGELPRGPVGPAVLHLDPRRPQGPRGHRAEDGGLGLPDAPSGRRRAGRDHQRAGLRHDRRHSRVGDHGGRRDPRGRCATASSVASARRTSTIR